MTAPAPDPRLLRLAEQVAGLDAPVGEPVLQQRLRETLDETAHALVDLALGQSQGQGPRRSPARGEGTQGWVGAGPSRQPPDRATCSAVAARCHQVAAALAPVVGIATDTPLAGAVRTALTTVADGLQGYVQDLASPAPMAAGDGRAGLHRALRRAAAALTPPAHRLSP